MVRYRRIRRLGRGAFAEVWLCEDQKLPRQVAIKYLIIEDPDALERFQQEAQVMAQIRHDHVLEIYDADFDATGPFLVLEYMPMAVSRLLEQGPLGLRQALDIVEQAACGLAELHAKGIIHRDVKPANMLMDNNQTVKISDLGTVKPLQQWKSIDTWDSRQIIGTPLFCPPERLKDDGDFNFAPSWDIYSLGVSLYQLVTGTDPFKANSYPQMVWQKCSKHEYPPPEEQRPGLPAEFAELITKMMEPDPDDRYADMQEVIAAISQVRDSLEPQGEVRDLPEPETAPDIHTQPTVDLQDPLQALENLIPFVGHGWYAEEHLGIEVPTQEEEVRAFSHILNFASATKRKRIFRALLFYYMQKGQWDQAREYSRQLVGEQSPYYKHLDRLIQRWEHNGALDKAWLQREKDLAARRIKGYLDYHRYRCSKCGKTFSQEALDEKEFFFLRKMICRACVLQSVRSNRKLLGEYQVAELPLGTDNYGTYYLGLHSRQQEDVILVHAVPWQRAKIEDSLSKILVQKYQRAWRQLSLLTPCPWFCELHNCEPLEDGQCSYFMLEYRPAMRISFYQQILLPEVRWKAILYLLVQISRGLEVLAAGNMAHRYLHPHQCFISLDGTVWINGFTLAKCLDTNDAAGNNFDLWSMSMLSIDQPSRTFGNPWYMSPEQAHGLYYADSRGDLWSWGVMAYELLTQQKPFPTEDPVAFRHQLRDQADTLPEPVFAQDFDPRMAAIIKCCLKVDQTQRYGHASDLLQDLSTLIP